MQVALLSGGSCAVIATCLLIVRTPRPPAPTRWCWKPRPALSKAFRTAARPLPAPAWTRSASEWGWALTQGHPACVPLPLPLSLAAWAGWAEEQLGGAPRTHPCSPAPGPPAVQCELLRCCCRLARASSIPPPPLPACSVAGWAQELMGGVSYIDYIRGLAGRLEEEWPGILADLQAIL